MNILLTGATGLIGQRIVRKLAQEKHKLFLLVRPESKQKAKTLFQDLEDVTFIEGDIEDTDVVKNIYTVSHFIDEIDCLVHLAAYYNLSATLTEAYLKNVIGTQNILHLMSKMKKLTHFHYFSTYAVNPISQGAVNENFLVQDNLSFPDEYSKTKNHAEHLVRKNKVPGVKTVIHRPGIIIGDSETGEMEKTDGPYYFFDFIQKLKKYDFVNSKLPFLPIPVQENSYLPVLPVDILTNWCSHIILNPPKEDLRCYHLIPSPAIKTQDFLEASMELLGLPLRILPIKQTKLVAPILPLVKIPKEAAFYMNQQTIFDRSQLTTDYPELTNPPYQKYLGNLIRGYKKARA